MAESGLRPVRPGTTAHVGLGLVAAALAARFVWAGDASYTFNEATYVELARHPWWSSFYPDQVFLRHPPLAFIVMAAWQAVFGDAEVVMRLPALAATLAGSWALWHASWRLGGDRAALLAGIVLAAAWPLHAYSLQATMYPFAFAAAAGAAWARAHERDLAEGVWLVVFALIHLFGFLFLALWGWEHRHRLAWVVKVGWPAAAWLGASMVVALLANTEGDIMRLGALGQAVRGGSTATDAVATRPAIHFAAGALGVWSLNLLLMARAATSPEARKRFAGWQIGVGLLAVYLFFAPPYPRYALLLLPFVLVAAASVPWPTGAPRRPTSAWTAAAVVGLLSFPIGFAYLTEGPDPRAAGDVPGVQEWADAWALLPEGAAIVATSGPTATAFYDMEAGLEVTNRTQAPYLIELQGGDRLIVRLDAPEDVAALELAADAWIVPDHWPGMDDDLVARGAGLCGQVAGLKVFGQNC
ncbi:MAG: ArnT family glycosyltransferase [Thermoplasmatota archaeon]